MAVASTEAARIPTFASSTRDPSPKARPAMKIETVNPIPATAATARHLEPSHPRREGRQAQPLGPPREPGDPDDLADHEPHQHAPRYGGGRRRPQAVGAQLDSRVRQREQWYDDEARPWMQIVRDPLRNRD